MGLTMNRCPKCSSIDVVTFEVYMMPSGRGSKVAYPEPAFESNARLMSENAGESGGDMSAYIGLLDLEMSNAIWRELGLRTYHRPVRYRNRPRLTALCRKNVQTCKT